MNFLKKVSHYLNKSVEENIITEQQKKEIITLIEGESGNIGTLKILSTIGAICIGIGFILLISSNWSSYGRLLQLIFGILLPLIPLIIGYYLYYFHKEFKIIGYPFILMGSILIGATIAIISQIYQIDAHIGYLFGVWFLFSIPLIYIFRFLSLATLSTFLMYGAIYSFLVETFFTSWQNQDNLLFTLIIISTLISVVSFGVNKITHSAYKGIFYPPFIISLKVLFLTLYIGTLDRSFIILGDSFIIELIYNILFLGAVGFVMFWANKNHEVVLRHSTFFWIGLYILTKYVLLFSGYFHAGVFFITTGTFIIALVYGLIKLNRYISLAQISKNESN
ncbi:DUF2157 domain-containing protein [Candidatus Gracilibacteria bacterium]|nr:DUF2157 domain-containing protein [Candidatus Gracilibacteria bacterium]